MNKYGKYQLEDETENPFEIHNENSSFTLKENKKRDIKKFDYAEDTKEIKNRFFYFYKTLFKELFRFPEDITGWTRYLTLFTALMYFLNPYPAICMALFLITEPVFVYKALYQKNPKWTIAGWGIQIFLLTYYLTKVLLDSGYYNSFMIITNGILMGLLVVLYFLCILCCLKTEKRIEIENEIRTAENEKVEKIAKKITEEEFEKKMKEKYFSRPDYSKQPTFSNTSEEGLSDINENFSSNNQKSDIKYFNTENLQSTNDDPDSIDVPDISGLDHN